MTASPNEAASHEKAVLLSEDVSLIEATSYIEAS